MFNLNPEKRSPMFDDLDDIINEAEKRKEDEEKQKVQDLESGKLQNVYSREMLDKVAVFLHGLGYAIKGGSLLNEDIILENITIDFSSDYARERFEKEIESVKEYFPELANKQSEEIIKFLIDVRRNVPEVMKGENIEGVYCDIEGTLFNGEELNNKTLEMLKGYETLGKVITLWTDGDISKLQALLNANGITYPLKNKIDFAGATAEIVIDNDSSNTFLAKTKIYPKEFIQVV